MVVPGVIPTGPRGVKGYRERPAGGQRRAGGSPRSTRPRPAPGAPTGGTRPVRVSSARSLSESRACLGGELAALVDDGERRAGRGGRRRPPRRSEREPLAQCRAACARLDLFVGEHEAVEPEREPPRAQVVAHLIRKRFVDGTSVVSRTPKPRRAHAPGQERSTARGRRAVERVVEGLRRRALRGVEQARAGRPRAARRTNARRAGGCPALRGPSARSGREAHDDAHARVARPRRLAPPPAASPSRRAAPRPCRTRGEADDVDPRRGRAAAGRRTPGSRRRIALGGAPCDAVLAARGAGRVAGRGGSAAPASAARGRARARRERRRPGERGGRTGERAAALRGRARRRARTSGEGGHGVHGACQARTRTRRGRAAPDARGRPRPWGRLGECRPRPRPVPSRSPRARHDGVVRRRSDPAAPAPPPTGRGAAARRRQRRVGEATRLGRGRGRRRSSTRAPSPARPRGRQKTSPSKSVRITQSGTLENVDVEGGSRSRRASATSRSGLPRAARAWGVALDGDNANVVVEDGGIDGGGACHDGMRGAGYVMRRLHVHDMGATPSRPTAQRHRAVLRHDARPGEGRPRRRRQMMGGGNVRIVRNNFLLTTGASRPASSPAAAARPRRTSRATASKAGLRRLLQPRHDRRRQRFGRTFSYGSSPGCKAWTATSGPTTARRRVGGTSGERSWLARRGRRRLRRRGGARVRAERPRPQRTRTGSFAWPRSREAACTAARRFALTAHELADLPRPSALRVAALAFMP